MYLVNAKSGAIDQLRLGDRRVGHPCHKSFRRDRECLTELLERAFSEPYPIQGIQLAEVGWESGNKGFERKRGWVVCIESWATFSVLV